MIRHARSADGTEIAVEESGANAGRPVVLLHGIAQSRRAFDALVRGALGATYRFHAVDLRGHGDSDRPLTREAYGPGRLGEDLAAVVAGLDRPVIVAWSYAGVALGEYLRSKAEPTAIGGIVLVAAATCVGKTAGPFFGAAMMENARALMSDDAAVYEAGAKKFIEACAATPLSPDFVARAVAEMRRVPAVARQALLTRNEDFSEELRTSTAPLAVIHGAADRVVLPALGRRAAALRPDATYIELEGGHLPWIEAPAAFESRLGAWLLETAALARAPP